MGRHKSPNRPRESSKVEGRQAGLAVMAALASGRGQAPFAWQLSSEMAAHVRVEFSALAQEGFVPGDKVRAMLASSALAQEELVGIWTLADRDKDGRLSEAEFALLRFLVFARQNGQALPNALPDSLLASVGIKDAPAPRAKEMKETKESKEGGKSDKSSAQGSEGGGGGGGAYATLAPAQYATYAASFAALQQRGLVSGAAAQPVLQQSGLPLPELAAVWALADQDKDGSLNEPEFVCALHLAATRLATKAPLPSALPSSLAQSVAQLAQAYAQAQQQQGQGHAGALALVSTGPGGGANGVNGAAVPPLPDLAIDAAVFELPTRTPLPPLPTSAPSPLDDESLVVQFGVSDSLVSSYSAVGDVARLGSEVLDADTGLRVLQQSEPELQQLMYMLERQEQLRQQLTQRHEQLNAEQRTLETATGQLQGMANQLDQHAQQQDADLQRAKEELRALVAEVTRAHETLSSPSSGPGGLQDMLTSLRTQQQQLGAEHAAQQQRMEQIMPEGQRLIAQLQQLTAPVAVAPMQMQQMPMPMQMQMQMQQQAQQQQQRQGGGGGHEDDSDEDSDGDSDSGVVGRAPSASSSVNKAVAKGASSKGAKTNGGGGGEGSKKKGGGLFGKKKK